MQLTCALTRQIYQPPVEPLQLQGPLYEKLGFRTRTTGQVQSPARRSSGGHLALPPPPACIHPPQHSRQAELRHFSWLKLSAWKQKNTQNTGYKESVSKVPVATLQTHQRRLSKASASGRKTGLEDRGLSLSTLLLQALENFVLSTVSIELKFCQILCY